MVGTAHDRHFASLWVTERAGVAHWGERNLAKVEAAGSKLRLPLVLCQAAKGKRDGGLDRGAVPRLAATGSPR